MKVKLMLALVLLIGVSTSSHAQKKNESSISVASLTQNTLSRQTQLEFALGFSSASLQSGNELMRAKELRTQGLSYYQNQNGTRRNVGSYAAPSGLTMKIGFYKPIKKINGLMAGLMVRNTLAGTQPSIGGYEEGYFFNFISASPTLKYYPFVKNNFYLNAEFGLASVFTKNRFLADTGLQNYFHQFGIGWAGGMSAGYSLTPFKNKSRAVDLQVHYQFSNTRVEVNGIGDDQWQFSSLHFTVGILL
jgi:hypothetical protein